MITNLGPNDCKMICYQTSVGPVSDFIARWLRETDQVNNNWDNLKTQLNFRYGHIPDASYAFELLNKVNQKIGENVPIFGERILTLATDAFRGQDINQPIVQLQLVNFFINGLYQDYLRMKIMRENPQTLAQAVNSAMAETQLRRKFDLKKNNGNERNITPMDISHYREIGVKCSNCNRFGHKAKYCRDKTKFHVNTVSSRAELHVPRGNFNDNTIGNNANTYHRRFNSVQNNFNDNTIGNNANTYPRRFNSVQNKSDSTGQQRRTFFCWNCGKPGHYERNCRARSNEQFRKPRENLN
ncbi:unnamed protein product [Mytilus edulis]|uniref:CCHC-type domain-containing protein n=1 Tax=Mytilus edulis TaxID=6550 RepID=A0A8S3S4S4_MYTED|nr:unnamed protein product [Mytilus edulis]